MARGRAQVRRPRTYLAGPPVQAGWCEKTSRWWRAKSAVGPGELPGQDSNLDSHIQSVESYHWTTGHQRRSSR